MKYKFAVTYLVLIFTFSFFYKSNDVLAAGACVCSGNIGVTAVGYVAAKIVLTANPSYADVAKAGCEAKGGGFSSSDLACSNMTIKLPGITDAAGCDKDKIASSITGALAGYSFVGNAALDISGISCKMDDSSGSAGAGGKTGGADKSNGKDIISLENPITLTDPASIIGKVINSLLAILGGLALIMVVMGGRTWLWSAGNPEKVEAGTKTITWAVLGLILTLCSYLLLSSILKYF